MKKEPSKEVSNQAKNGNKKATSWQPGMVMFARLSGWIAFPVIIALFLGKWLDDRYGTEPWLLLVTVGVAFLVTSVGIIKEAARSFKEIEEQAKENPTSSQGLRTTKGADAKEKEKKNNEEES